MEIDWTCAQIVRNRQMEIEMQASNKVKTIVTAIGLSMGVAAHAAQINVDNIANVGSGTGAGNLVLAVLDATGARSLVFNLGETTNSFITKANTSFTIPNEASLNAFLNGVTDVASVKWNIGAIRNVISFDGFGEAVWNDFGFQTTAKPATSVVGGLAGNGPNSADPGITNASGAAGVFFGFNNQLPANPLGSANTVAVTSASNAFFNNGYGNNFGGAGSFNNTAGLNEAAEFFFFHGIGDGGLGATQADKFAGKWAVNFTQGGAASVSYSVNAVPVPAAVWMLGSALCGLVTIKRRKDA